MCGGHPINWPRTWRRLRCHRRRCGQSIHGATGDGAKLHGRGLEASDWVCQRKGDGGYRCGTAKRHPSVAAMGVRAAGHRHEGALRGLLGGGSTGHGWSPILPLVRVLRRVYELGAHRFESQTTIDMGSWRCEGAASGAMEWQRRGRSRCSTRERWGHDRP